MMYKVSPFRDQGSILVQFALLLLVLVTVLGVVQIGYLHYVKRDLQRMADMAALEAIEALKERTTCVPSREAGDRSIARQWVFPHALSPAPLQQDVVCLRWTAAAGEVAASESIAPFNAVKVRLKGQGLHLLPFTGPLEVYAEAIAAIKDDPIAAFTVGSGVARLNGGALNTLLSLLLGTQVSLSVADYEGLANANVDLLGLTQALNLNAGSYDELLGANISLSRLLQASASVIRNEAAIPTAEISASVIDDLLRLPIKIDLDKIFLKLLSDSNQNGLLDIGIYKDNPATALTADVSVLNILLVGLQLANMQSAAALQTGINIPGLASIELKAKIIEPPMIAVGAPGYINGAPKTSAHTGQVRIGLEVRALNTLNGSDDFLDINIPLLARIRVSLPGGSLLKLPLYLEVGSGEGILESISCYANAGAHRVQIKAHSGLAKIFVGNIPEAFDNNKKIWSMLQKDKETILGLGIDVSALGMFLKILALNVELQLKAEVAVENKSSKLLEFDYDYNKPRSSQELIKSVGMGQSLGGAIANIFRSDSVGFFINIKKVEVLGINVPGTKALQDGINDLMRFILSGLLPLISAVLAPILDILDGILLGPLLKLLGVQIGYADVELLWANCSNGQLVQ